MKRTKKLLCVLLAVSIAFLWGCGSPLQNEDETVFRVGGITVDTLNPLTTYVAGAIELMMLIYDPLIRYDENLDPVPCLAESWELDDDELTWTFHLVKNAKWHDGEPVTSADVKFTYDLMLEYDVGYSYSAYLYGIEDISCPDDYTVVMTTEEPKANMLMNPTPILPEHIWGQIPEEDLEQELNEHPIGSGPFMFDSKDSANTNWTLVRNDDYFGDKPYVDSLVFIYYASTDSMTQALKLGEIDGFFESEASQLATLQSDPNIDVLSAKLPGFSQIGINVYEDGTGNPLLQDINIRYAMEYAVDREKIKDMVFYGCAETGSTIMSSVGRWHYEIPADEFRSYDLDKANAILDAAGYTERNSEGTRLAPDGSPLEFNMLYSADVVARGKIASFLKSGCDEIGIKINNMTNDSSAIADAIADYSYDLFIWGWFEEIDPTPMLNILTSEELFMNNETGWTDDSYDELFYEQQTELDKDARLAIIQEMQAIAYEGCQYIVVAYDEEIQAIRSDKWTGYKSIPASGGPYFINNTFINYMNIRPVQ